MCHPSNRSPGRFVRAGRSALFFAIAATSCTQQGSGTDKTEAFFRLFNQHDWHAMAALYAPTAEMLDPAYGGTPVRMERTEIEAKYIKLSATIADVHDSLVSVSRTGDGHVFVEFISTGTAPDGKRFSLPLISHMAWRNGLVLSDRTYYDKPCDAR